MQRKLHELTVSIVIGPHTQSQIGTTEAGMSAD
jgi:hypothetical protein